MEFSRFGGNITNYYWGCCACDIIQNFNYSPDQKASIQLVDGDGATAILKNGKQLYAGPTYKDIFLQRLRFGTFSTADMPNHAFLAIITQDQISCGYGKQWLEILKETGFEFIRTINNSVYTGNQLLGSGDVEDEYDEDYDDEGEYSIVHGSSANYLFGLFRNIGMGAASNPFQPPKEWTELPGGVPTIWSTESVGNKDEEELTRRQQEFHKKVWDGLPTTDTLMTEEELRENNVPVWLSGKRVNDAKPKIKPKDAPISKEVSLKAGSVVAPPVAPVAPTGSGKIG